MTDDLQNYLIQKTEKMISFDFCCSEARAAAEKWLSLIGTDKEYQAVSDYLTELADCIMPVDELIEFCKGELAFFIFGKSQQDEIAHAYKLKEEGAEYCDCPVCRAAQDIINRKNEILYGSKNIKIRKIDKQDSREEISNVYEQSWKYAYKGIIPQEFLDSIPSGRWCGAVDKPDMNTLVMLDRDRIIGTSCFCKSRYEVYSDWGEVISIYFLPEYMGRGYGRDLFRAAVDELKIMGFKSIFLWVLEENYRARRFYEKYGFKNSGERLENNIGGKTFYELRYIYHIEGE